MISTSDCKCNKASKIDEYLDIKNCSCEKRLFCIRIWRWNSKYSWNLPDDKKVICEKFNCLIHTI